MARRVSVGSFQELQRAGNGPPPTVTADDQADQLGERIADRADRLAAELIPDREPTEAENRATVPQQLQALGVELVATAEWSRSLIVASITQRSFAVDPAPTDEEIQAEADRIWTSFGDNRAGPRVATVDGATGEVRDWRRPDTTPDRGPDVGTTHHTITDDEEPRFSGAGAPKSDVPFGSASDLIPTDAQFNSKLYRDAPELANIAERLIGEHGFLGELINCDIRWYWKRKTGVSKGRVKIGFMKRASDLLGHFSGADFIGWLSATTARDGKFTDAQIEAAVFHQLCHVGADDNGNWIFAPHDFEGFAQEVRHYGTWTEGLKLGGSAFAAAQQMGLFDAADTDEDEEDDEGEAAERAYFDEAGEAMERDIASGAFVPDEDQPADPDGPAPDEDDDPLADHDV